MQRVVQNFSCSRAKNRDQSYTLFRSPKRKTFSFGMYPSHGTRKREWTKIYVCMYKRERERGRVGLWQPLCTSSSKGDEGIVQSDLLHCPVTKVHRDPDAYSRNFTGKVINVNLVQRQAPPLSTSLVSRPSSATERCKLSLEGIFNRLC